jgi:archaemetzincin
MNLVRLLPVGEVESSVLECLRSSIARTLHLDCEILDHGLDPLASYHLERQQYHSSELLHRMYSLARPSHSHLLGITEVDLYIPILKYVFGEAQLGGPCAIVSFYRLRQEFYGLERDDALLNERLLKESLHELGHTLDLRHCPDYRCAMSSAHAVEWVDLRAAGFCESCSTQFESKRQPAQNHKAYSP